MPRCARACSSRSARRAGVAAPHADGERLDYDDAPLFESLERSGWSYGGGAEHLLPFASERGGWIAWGGCYLRRDTDATRDELGFAGAYDDDRWRGSLRGAIPLPFQIRARAELVFDAELYANRNVIDALTRGSALAGAGATSSGARASRSGGRSTAASSSSCRRASPTATPTSTSTATSAS